MDALDKMRAFVKDTPVPPMAPEPIKDPKLLQKLPAPVVEYTMRHAALAQLAPHVTGLLVKEMLRLRREVPDPDARYHQALDALVAQHPFLEYAKPWKNLQRAVYDTVLFMETLDP